MEIKNFIIVLLSFLAFGFNNTNKCFRGSITKNESLNEKNFIHGNVKRFLIVTHDYDFESNSYGIVLNELILSGNSLKSTKRFLSFGKYKDVLVGGKYNSSGAYYPVQIDLDRNKAYISIYRADEMEGTFDYNKILECNLENDSIKEVVSFSDYFNSWFLSKSNQKIYGFDNSNKSVISIDLLTSQVETLYNSPNYFEDIEYHLKNDNSLDIITFDRENGVSKFIIDLNTNQVEQTKLLQLSSFSSYNEGTIIETYKDFRNDVEELRLYKGSNKKTIPFDFKNFNTHWIDETKFIVMKKDKILKMNTDFEFIGEFSADKIHVIDVTDNAILVSYYDNEVKKAGFLDFEFENLVEIPDIKPNEIVLIMDK